jgi:hypothetical protein
MVTTSLSLNRIDEFLKKASELAKPEGAPNGKGHSRYVGSMVLAIVLISTRK